MKSRRTLPWMMLLLQLCVCKADLSISPCGSDSTAEVRQGETKTTFTCRGVMEDDDVIWKVWFRGTMSPAGTCPKLPGNCFEGSFGVAFVPFRSLGTESGINVNANELSSPDVVKEGTLVCSDGRINTSCQMDYIVPVGSEGSCSIQTGTGPSRYKVSGQCTGLQPGAKSSRGRYRCEWFRERTTVSNITLTLSNYQTECYFADKPIPTTTGQYNYHVIFIPGRTRTSAGNLNVQRPTADSITISCNPNGIVPVNTNVTCTCTSTNVGQPQGRLKWVKVSDTTVINEGVYGTTTLEMTSQTVRLNDDGLEKFRCDVEWAESITGAVFRANVGYPPNNVVLHLDDMQDNLTVNEGQNVTFCCAPTKSKPTSIVTLINQDNGIELSSKESSSLSHTVRARCEDSARYVCKADNAMGPPVTSAARTLLAQCKPRRSQVQLDPINYQNKSVSVDFVVTAYPLPIVAFAFLGNSAQESEQTAVAKVSDKISLKGSCVTGEKLYTAKCTVTVESVNSEDAVGIYQVNVSNTQGYGLLRVDILYYEPTQGDLEDGPSPAAIGGAIGGSILAVLLIIAVCVAIRRGWCCCTKAPCCSGAAKNRPMKLADLGVINGGDANVGNMDQGEQSDTPPQPAFIGQPLTDKPIVDDEYAVVNKKANNKPPAKPEVSINNHEATYAVVKKENKKKKPEPAKPKATSKDKPKKGKGSKTPTTAGQDEAHIYSNFDSKPNSVDPKPKGKGKKSKAAAQPEPSNDSTGKQQNQDGLEYTTVVFGAASQKPKTSPSPKDQGVEYSTIAFK